MREATRRVVVASVAIDAVTESEVIDIVVEAARRGDGGILATPNLDHLAMVRSGLFDRRLLDDADLVVADGMPLVWASRIAGNPLPERVAGSKLLPKLCGAAASAGLPVVFLGGRVGAGDKAAADLRSRYPALEVRAVICPPLGFDKTAEGRAGVVADVVAAGPSLVFTALGAPKQEQVNAWLAPHVPSAWLVSCGATLDMIAGDVVRAPAWVQRTGMEWLWRLAQEPQRLAGRYLIRDLPFAGRLFSAAAVARWRISIAKRV